MILCEACMVCLADETDLGFVISVSTDANFEILGGTPVLPVSLVLFELRSMAAWSAAASVSAKILHWFLVEGILTK